MPYTKGGTFSTKESGLRICPLDLEETKGTWDIACLVSPKARHCCYLALLVLGAKSKPDEGWCGVSPAPLLGVLVDV